MKLLQALAQPDVTARQLELVISGDPGLAATVLTSAEAPFMMHGARHLSIREAVMRVGMEALKAIAISVSLRALHTKAPGIAKGRFARHSVAVAYTAKHLFARQFMDVQVKATLTQDEVYAVGLLHDIGFLLFASQDVRSFERMEMAAKRAGSSISASFRHTYERDLCDLVPALFDRWPHMTKLSKAIVSLGRPWELPEERDALACLLAADYLVTVPLNLATEDRAITEEPRPEVADLCDSGISELEVIQSGIQAHFQKCGIA